jgi:hypothetical protein
MQIDLSLAAALLPAFLAPGCASQRQAPPAIAAADTPSQSLPKVDIPRPMPAAGAPQPIYRNPKIAAVILRSHQDAEGRLFGPQVMYQVTDPGGWNLEAVEEGRGFIPDSDTATPPGGRPADSPPAREAPPMPRDAPLLDPERAARIAITGLMGEEDRPRAEALARQAGGGTTAVFDPSAGWLLIPGR